MINSRLDKERLLKIKRRQLQKIFKIVARQISRGDFTKLKPVHFWTIDKKLSAFQHGKYDTEFRPWWYSEENFKRWRELDYKTQVIKHLKLWDKQFEKWSGINMDLYKQYFQLHHARH